MRVAMVKLYDEYCHGPRLLHADLMAQGHESYLISLKPFHMGRRGFGAFNPDLLNEIRKTDAWVEIQYDGEVFLPEHLPISAREEEVFINFLAEIKPDMVCFSVTSDDAAASAKYTKMVKEHFPDVLTVWGGVEISHEASTYINCADLMVRGEGEVPLRMLAADPTRRDIPGLSYLDDNGNLVENEVAPLIQDCDSLQWPAYGVNEFLIHDDILHRITIETHRDYLAQRYIIMTGRGCPFKCSFCHHWKTHEIYEGEKYLRRRTPKLVVDHLEWAHEVLGVNSVMFWDDVFLMNRKWIEEFAAEFKKRLRFPIGGLSFPSMTTPAMIDAVRDCPFVCVGFGIQSGSEFVVQGLYNRGYFNQKIKDIAWYCHEQGIEVTYDFLVNNPYESEDDARASLRLILDMPVPYNVITKRLFIYPNSPLNRVPYPRHNLSETVWQHYTMLMHLARDPNVPRETIWDMAHNAHLKNHPEITTDFVKSCLDRWNVERGDVSSRRLKELNDRIPMQAAGLGAKAKRLVKGVFGGTGQRGSKHQNMPAEDGLIAH